MIAALLGLNWYIKYNSSQKTSHLHFVYIIFKNKKSTKMLYLGI